MKKNIFAVKVGSSIIVKRIFNNVPWWRHAFINMGIIPI